MTTEEIAELANETLRVEDKLKRLKIWEESARKDGVSARVEMSFVDKRYARSQLTSYLGQHEIVALIGAMILKEQSKLFQLEAQMDKLRKAT